MRQVVRAIALCVVPLWGCHLGGPCEIDADCSGDRICADNGECASADGAPAWRITWTVNGAAVSRDAPGDCSAISELAVRVRSSVNNEGLEFRPVPCELGQFDFRALPARFDRVSVDAFAGDILLVRSDARREAINAVDLRF